MDIRGPTPTEREVGNEAAPHPKVITNNYDTTNRNVLLVIHILAARVPE